MLPVSITDMPRRSFPIVTLGIIVLNVIVFLYELTLGDAVQDFILRAGVVPAEYLCRCDISPTDIGTYWITLFTSMWMHGGFLHIAGNMLYLWIFGDNVEDTFGRLGYTLFYLASGLVSGVTQILANPASEVPGLGASGAIAGVLAAYLVLFPQAQVRTLIFLGPFITFPRLSAFFLLGIWFLIQLADGIGSIAQTSGTDHRAVQDRGVPARTLALPTAHRNRVSVMTPLTLVLPMDGSPLDGRSLGYATGLAAPNAGKLALLSVISDVALWEPTMARLTDIAEYVRSSAGLRVTTDVRVGDAAAVIVETAGTARADAIVLASDRSSRLDAWLNGDLGAQVLDRATTPVLIVPGNGAAAPTLPPRLLVPVCRVDAAKRSVRLATRLAAATGGEVILLRVLEVDPVAQAHLDTGGARPDDLHPDAAPAQAELDKLVQSLAASGVRARGVLRLGEPSPTIIATAREMAVDVVLVDRDDAALLAHELSINGIPMLAPGHA
jgi:membrane associated rhomboid family serine protease/nucleotide-binding universal stress UspA family protein